MALSANIRKLLEAYDSFTDFAGGPDLPWVVDIYDALDDDAVRIMIRSLCYAWAAGQRATGCYDGFVERLAQTLFEALPGWDGSLTYEDKITWVCRLGLRQVLPAPEPRPNAASGCADHPGWNDLAVSEQAAIEDMAAFFQIELSEAILMYHMGRALRRTALPPGPQDTPRGYRAPI